MAWEFKIWGLGLRFKIGLEYRTRAGLGFLKLGSGDARCRFWDVGFRVEVSGVLGLWDFFRTPFLRSFLGGCAFGRFPGIYLTFGAEVRLWTWACVTFCP